MKKSLESWVKSGWLRNHEPEAGEVAQLLEKIERDLEDCRTSGLSADWKFSIAYNAIIVIASEALLACGYRAERESHHYWSIQSLGETLRVEPETLEVLDSYRKKRNLSTYESAGQVSDREAEDIAALADELWQRLLRWLKDEHPETVS
jgi:hypothetical protein